MIIHAMARKRAFSLIEVLLAIFLVALSALLVGATMPVASVSRAKANFQDKAMGMAQKQLEAIRGLGYSNASPTQLFSYGLIDSTSAIAANTYSFTNSDSTSLDNPSRILPSGSGKVMIEQVDLDLRRVTVTVSWSDRGTVKSYVLGTLIANL